MLTEDKLSFARLIESTTAEQSTWCSETKGVCQSACEAVSALISGRPCRLNWSHKIHHHNKSLRLDADKLREAFHRLDKDDNNYLDLAEITEALRQLHEAGTIPTAARSEDIELIFRTMDVDHNGYLDLSEFQELARRAMLCNTIIDFIPLEEIDRIEYEIMPVEQNVLMHARSLRNNDGLSEKIAQQDDTRALAHSSESRHETSLPLVDPLM